MQLVQPHLGVLLVYMMFQVCELSEAVRTLGNFLRLAQILRSLFFLCRTWERNVMLFALLSNPQRIIRGFIRVWAGQHCQDFLTHQSVSIICKPYKWINNCRAKTEKAKANN